MILFEITYQQHFFINNFTDGRMVEFLNPFLMAVVNIECEFEILPTSSFVGTASENDYIYLSQKHDCCANYLDINRLLALILKNELAI